MTSGASECEPEKTWYHYASDEQGSIVFISDEEKVCNKYDYDAWGNLTTCEEIIPNRFLYTGQQFDQITQQYYLRARYYNPVIARFTKEDVYRGDGLNLYTYCNNNPVIYYDPSGYNACNKPDFKNPTRKNRNEAWKRISKEIKEKNIDVSAWDKGSFDCVEDSVANHFYKHGREVGADTVEQYLQKSIDFARNTRNARKTPVSGATYGVTRYSKNGKYVDLTVDRKIISFGKK